MKYLLKEEKAEEIRKKYHTSYLKEASGISTCYVSLIKNRKRAVPKRVAIAFTKAIDNNLEVEDLFTEV